MGLLSRTDNGAQTPVNNPSEPARAAVGIFQPTRKNRGAFGRDVAAANVGIVDKRNQKAPSGASAMPTVPSATAQIARRTGDRRSGGFFAAVTAVQHKGMAMPKPPALPGASALPAQISQKMSYYGATASARTQSVVSSGDDMPTSEKLELLRVSVLSVKEKEEVVVKYNGKEFAIKKYIDNNGTAWVKVDKRSSSDREKNDFENYLRINQVFLIDVVDNLKASDVNDASENGWLGRFRSALSW